MDDITKCSDKFNPQLADFIDLKTLIDMLAQRCHAKVILEYLCGFYGMALWCSEEIQFQLEAKPQNMFSPAFFQRKDDGSVVYECFGRHNYPAWVTESDTYKKWLAPAPFKCMSCCDKGVLLHGPEKILCPAVGCQARAEQIIERALEYMHPHLDTSSLGAADWAVAMAAILTGGTATPIPVECGAMHPLQQYQTSVGMWMAQCFEPGLYTDMQERGDRYLEESLELLQAGGYDRTRVATLVDYVWGRPVGEPSQEVGGVMVTLAGYCDIAGIDMANAAETELRRIWEPEVMQRIREKQAAKRGIHTSPLPGSAT